MMFTIKEYACYAVNNNIKKNQKYFQTGERTPYAGPRSAFDSITAKRSAIGVNFTGPQR